MIKITSKIAVLWGGFMLAFLCLLIGLDTFCTELATNDSVSASEPQKNITKAISNKPNKYTCTYDNDDTQASNTGVQTTSQQQTTQEDIAKNILRLHVIANSDSDYDQYLKLLVRDEIITSLQNALQSADSVLQAKAIVANRQSQIQSTALHLLHKYDCNFAVNVQVGKRYFPIKQYGDLTFPAGTYDALCVEIGEAEGHNWWCVLFPSLCFVNETTATVPDDSKKKLRECLPDEEYNSLTENDSASNTSSANCSPSPDNTDNSDNQSQSSNAANPDTEIHLGILDWFTKAK